MWIGDAHLGGCSDGDDEGRNGGASQVHESALCNQNNSLSVWPNHVVHLRTNLFPSQLRSPQTPLNHLHQLSIDTG